MNVLPRILARPSEQERGLWPAEWANIDGRLYPLGLNQTLVGTKEEIGRGFDGLATGAYQASSVVYACMAARLALSTETFLG